MTQRNKFVECFCTKNREHSVALKKHYNTKGGTRNPKMNRVRRDHEL